MNHVFEKALLSLLFYIQNHYFDVSNFYPFSFPTFLWKGTWKPFYLQLSAGSTQEDPSRHDWKIVDIVEKNQNKQNNHDLIFKRYLMFHKI